MCVLAKERSSCLHFCTKCAWQSWYSHRCPASALHSKQQRRRAAAARRVQASKVLSLPGSAAAVNELRVLLCADLFIMTDELAAEKVTNGIVTRALTSWVSDAENVRQVELLTWLARELSGWDYFAPKPRGTTDPAQARRPRRTWAWLCGCAC
jgi:hypothetical protein